MHYFKFFACISILYSAEIGHYPVELAQLNIHQNLLAALPDDLTKGDVYAVEINSKQPTSLSVFWNEMTDHLHYKENISWASALSEFFFRKTPTEIPCYFCFGENFLLTMTDGKETKHLNLELHNLSNIPIFYHQDYGEIKDVSSANITRIPTEIPLSSVFLFNPETQYILPVSEEFLKSKIGDTPKNIICQLVKDFIKNAYKV